jgi:hypothetical protein
MLENVMIGAFCRVKHTDEARDKALSKQILAYHAYRCRTRGVPPGPAVRRPKRLRFPLIVNR